jgi:hypothetical protein
LVVCGLLAGGVGVPIAIGDPGFGGVGQDSGSQDSEDSSTVERDVNSVDKPDGNGGNLGGRVNANVDERGIDPKGAPASDEDKRDQDSRDPKDPKNADPTTLKDPEPTAREKPEPTVPEKPEPTVPEKPEPTVPQKPEPTVPEKPEPTVAERPEPTEPTVAEKPEPTVPQKPEPTVAERPEPTVAEKPEPTVAERPEPTVAEKPEPTVPERPEPTVPQKPEPTTPTNPEPNGPGGPGGGTGEASFWTWFIQLFTGSGGTGGGSSNSGGGDGNIPTRTPADILVDQQRELTDVLALLVVVGAIAGLADDAGAAPATGGGGGPGSASLPLAQFAGSDAVTDSMTPAAVDEPLPTTVPPQAVSMLPPEPPPIAGLNQATQGPVPVTMPVATGRLPKDFRVGYATYLRSASMREVASIAMLGLSGLIVLTAAGGVVGYRQAKAGLAVRAAGTARFLQ